MAFNGYYYRLLVRDLKIHYGEYNYKNTKDYLIIYGKYVNAIFYKRIKSKVEVLFATQDKIVKKKKYHSDYYFKVAKKFIKDFKVWNT